MNFSEEDKNQLANIVTGRTSSYFSQDLIKFDSHLRSQLEGKKILIFGAAGFIARQTINVAIQYKPRELVLVDINENSLTDLIRELRLKYTPTSIPTLTPILADVTSNRIFDILELHSDINAVWNFAAVKHVRSERDPISLFRMFDVNIFGMWNVVKLANALSNVDSVFSVSTDKAANPASYMGFSKRIMELVLFSLSERKSRSTRFANVAFSQGSLLELWLSRLSQNQILPVPRDTKRFFVSPIESGHLCLLAATLESEKGIFVPTLDPAKDLNDLESILERILSHLNLDYQKFEVESDARNFAPNLAKSNVRTMLLTNRDTSGEKAFEEFVGLNEVSQTFSDSLQVISSNNQDVQELIESLEFFYNFKFNHDNDVELQEIYEIFQNLLSNFSHVNSSKSLDTRI